MKLPAAEAGVFAAEIEPVEVKVKSNLVMMDADEYPRGLKAKLEADADEIFGRLDVDADGSVTRKELEEYLCDGCGYDSELATSMLKALDFDASGAIDQDEFRSGFLKHPAMRTAPGLGGGPCAAI